MGKLVTYVFLIGLLAVTGDVSARTIRHLDTEDTVDKHGIYFVQLLELALQKSAPKYGQYSLESVSAQLRQDRQFKTLNAGMIDVMWTVTTEEREKMAMPVRIPLLKGLIGNRVLVIDKKNATNFAQAKTLSQLAQFTAVQGHDWPDAAILEGAGLKVERIVWHSTMYKLISSGIVDYFPRSILEVLDEIEAARDPNIIIEPTHLLVYPSAIYFFVNKQDEKLAQRLEYGLRMAIEDGSFDRVFYGFEGHLQAINEIKVEGRTVHRLKNPLFPQSAPIDEKNLWFTPIESL